jgi:glyoxylase-like metal-dependent hydrolase (beta-lactamase superfamily II)
MFFKQIKHRGDNFSYIIADGTTREAAVVDPSFNADAIKQTVKNHNFKVNYIINTHHHTDHTACNEDVRATFNAKIVAHEFSGVDKDLSVIDGDVIRVGHINIHVIHTPGHTPDSMCLLFDDKLLTGDTLFVGECGRTDLPGGSVEDMYNSLFQKLMKLDDDIEVYPGHDYGPAPSSTMGLEKKTNYTLVKRTLEAFIEFMKQP